MLNHGPDINTFLNYDKGARSVVLRTDRDYAAGEQVKVSYGQRSGGDLLLSYGFVPTDNPYDSTEVVLALREDDQWFAEKTAALQSRNLSSDGQVFPVRINALTNEMLGYARLTVADVDDESDIPRVADFAFQEDTGVWKLGSV